MNNYVFINNGMRAERREYLHDVIVPQVLEESGGNVRSEDIEHKNFAQ